MYCSQCGTKASIGASFCAGCGTAVQQNQQLQTPTYFETPTEPFFEGQKPRRNMNREFILLAVILMIAIVGASAFAINSLLPKPKEIAESVEEYVPLEIPTPDPVWLDEWVPSGYFEMATDEYGPTVVGKWVDNPNCDYYTRCSWLKVQTRLNCDLYVTVNFVNGNTVVDWSIDTVNISAGQKARLEFVSYEDNANNTEITETNCY
jgi:hypothetical protein